MEPKQPKSDLEQEEAARFRTFRSIIEVANTNNARWAPGLIPLEADREAYLSLPRRGKKAFTEVWATRYCAENIVELMLPKIIAAGANVGLDTDLIEALRTQAVEESLHRTSVARVGHEVIGIKPKNIDKVAKKHNNFAAKQMFARFDEELDGLLLSG